tara:strand:+ start:86 stop:751 length:666 start_codon:yes stop_codon:yes gene_type:complete
MIYSINRKNKLITPENAATLIPVFISSIISIFLIVFLVIPQYVKSTKVNFELNALIRKKNELDNLKSQYKIINNKFSRLKKEKSIIIELISGTSNLDTLLAKLGELGKKNNIEFVSIEPKKMIAFVDNKESGTINKNDNLSNLVIDPLLVEGTKKFLIDVSFKTDFVSFLSFLRELEFQENVILLDDMNLKLPIQESNKSNININKEILEVKFAMTIYGKV